MILDEEESEEGRKNKLEQIAQDKEKRLSYGVLTEELIKGLENFKDFEELTR